MYLFFDRQGTLLEIVNDVAMRQYNTNVNKIYVHIQDDTAPESGRIPKHIVALKHWYLPYGKTAKDSIYGNPAVRPGTLTSEDTIWDENKDGTVSDSEKPATNSFVRETVPYNRNRDLKHFVYGRTYEFFVLNIPSGGFTATPCTSEGCMCAELSQEGDVFNFSGLVQGTIQTVHYDHSCLALERFSFTIEDSVLLPEKAVTGSQFSWLLTELLSMSGKVNGLDDYNNILANKPIINEDLSSAELVADTYYKHTGEDGMYKTGVIYYYNGTKLIAIDGGTSLTLNGEETDNAAIYAPISGGDNTGVKVLVPHGEGEEPTWETLSVVKNGREYTIKLGNVPVGTIELPQETYIDSISYNSTTRVVTFSYNSASGKDKKTINLSSLADLAKIKQFNGDSNKFAKDVSFYAPTSAGSSGNILFSNGGGAPTWGSFNVNGSTAKSANIFAPTSVGSSGQVLLSDGSGAPSWADFKVNNGSVLGKSIYAPTEAKTPESNTCWVLVPNGSNAAPVWKELTVEKNGLVYALKLGGIKFGEIALTEDIYLDDVTYDKDKNYLIFTYNTARGEAQIEVDLTDLVDMYEAGNGLVRDNGVFSIKIAPDSEKYLKATAEGLVFDESALAGGNVALPESHTVTFGGTSWSGTMLNGMSCYSSTISLTDFGFTSDITSGGSVILSPYSSNDAKLLRRYGVFYSNKYEHNDTVQIYAQSPEVMLSFPEIKFNMTYIPSGNTSSNGAVIIQNSYDGTDISTVAIKTTDWQTYWGDINEDGEANEAVYYQSPTYYIDYTSYVVFAPNDAESQKELIRCGAYTTTEIEGISSGAYPFAIRVQTLPTIDITLKKMTTWVGEVMGIATLNLPTAPPLPSVTHADSGKFLRVDANGKWVAESIPNAEEASF